MAKLIVGYKITIGYFVVLAAVVLVILVLQHSLVDAKPYGLWTSYDDLIPISLNGECVNNAEVETLCQKCAKQTKSNIVYPMCCENTEEARDWCRSYLDFGLQ